MPKPKSWFFKTIFILVWIFLGAFFFYKELLLPTHAVEAKTLKPQVLSEKVSQSVVETLPLVQNISPNLASAIQISQTVPKADDYTINLPVLMYHYIRSGISQLDTMPFSLSVTPESLDKQLSYLHDQGFQTVSLNDVYEALSQGMPLPPKSVVLTFDDGYRDFYTDAFPLLKKYNLRAVSFYITSYTSYPTYMNWQMLHEIHNSGLVDIESHTVDHFQLTKLSPEEQKREIFDSKKTLEEGLGKKIYFFAYPYGDLNPAVMDLVRSAGYKLAFGTKVGTTMKRSEMLQLERISITGSDSLEQFIKKVNPTGVVVQQNPIVEQQANPAATSSARPQAQ